MSALLFYINFSYNIGFNVKMVIPEKLFSQESIPFYTFVLTDIISNSVLLCFYGNKLAL